MIRTPAAAGRGIAIQSRTPTAPRDGAWVE
jgi:hypothetical protein